MDNDVGDDRYQGGGSASRAQTDAPPVRLLIASTNPHKVDEFRALLAGLPFELVGLSDVEPVGEVEETGETFAENAVLKAVEYARATGLLALADDSGLEIDALGGEPGIYSARWAGLQVTYPERFRIILDRLASVPESRCTARYRCAIAVAGPGDMGLRGVVEGTLEGEIAQEPRGSGGFGYDPIFYVPELGRTVGELSAGEKHRISHRARAAAAARDLLIRLSQPTQR
ncbi:MAG TPA: RdgB/HAM1 family non-canonical purine NTP pyrophosphatase [Ktedonobacterales bacterium]